jgi:hypothetical protein
MDYEQLESEENSRVSGGLSIQTLHWAISGGDSIKEHDSDNFPMSQPGEAREKKKLL